MASKSYWIYGQVKHKEGAMIPEGRILIDTAKSFIYGESGLKGVLLASRLTGLSPNLTSRFTPGTLISSYEVYESITAISRELLMQIKGMAEDMGFEVLHGIVDCLWVKGEPISSYKEAVERETGILTEVASYDWITFLPMADGSGAYNRYFGRLTTGKMKVRGVATRRGDTPEYIKKMQQGLFEVLAEAKSLEELRLIEPKAQGGTKEIL